VHGPNLKLYTWGYTGRTQAELFDLMTQQRIALVVDVRQRPWSRDARWGKRELTATFGANYRHLPRLGNRSRNVPKVQLVDEEKGLAHLEELLSVHQRVLIMCLERDPSRCHRSYVAQRMEERIEGLEIADL
jgi:uncharacterized protein (DUF488 family)